ncbi:MAG TPA: CoA transferase [Pseudonocardia sp.]|nr:CoA transferase [Pseudonocardia sp.]
MTNDAAQNHPAGNGPALDEGAAPRGPLSDVRVVEMGSLLAGPFCGQLLGDFGAEVIKIEPPGSGDPMRQWGREKPHGMSLWWPVVGRNKKSVTVNLRVAEGQELVRALVAKSDIVVENFRPGTLERWNLGYEDLAAINPGVILIRVTGFGQTGPYAGQAGYGAIGEAMGGLRYISGDPERPPSRIGISIGDALAGTFGTVGGLVALHARHATGRGQVVDTAIYEAVLGLMESLIPEYQLAGYVRERTGSILPNVAPSNVYPCADGKMLLIAANQDTVFRRLAGVMGSPELADDERFATHSARGDHQQELDDLIAAWTATLPEEKVMAALVEAGVPAGRIYTAREMLTDPHFAARDAIVRLAHPHFGEIAMQNVVPKLSATPGAVTSPGPELGQHNDEILGSLLGIDEAARSDLAGRGVI